MTTKRQNKQIVEIAKQILDLETLEERKSDSFDFHKLEVWTIKHALEKAYEAGRRETSKTK